MHDILMGAYKTTKNYQQSIGEIQRTGSFKDVRISYSIKLELCFLYGMFPGYWAIPS